MAATIWTSSAAQKSNIHGETQKAAGVDIDGILNRIPTAKTARVDKFATHLKAALTNFDVLRNYYLPYPFWSWTRHRRQERALWTK